MEIATVRAPREPWNKGKLVGQKSPLKVKDIWAIRVRLQMQDRVRELAMFDIGIDSKLRGWTLRRFIRRIGDCDLGWQEIASGAFSSFSTE